MDENGSLKDARSALTKYVENETVRDKIKAVLDDYESNKVRKDQLIQRISDIQDGWPEESSGIQRFLQVLQQGALNMIWDKKQVSEAGHGGGLANYDYRIHQKYAGAVPVQVTPDKKYDPIKFSDDDFEDIDTQDSGMEHDTPYQEYLSGKEVFQKKPRPRGKNESVELRKALDFIESGAGVDRAVKFLAEGVIDQIVEQLRRILKGNKVSPLAVNEQRMLEFIKDVRYDKAGIRKPTIVEKFVELTGIAQRVVEQMYSVVKRQLAYA